MMMCANENCKKDPLENHEHRVVTCDGDFVCNAECEQEYEKQKARFFNEIVHCPEKTKAWLMGE